MLKSLQTEILEKLTTLKKEIQKEEKKLTSFQTDYLPVYWLKKEIEIQLNA